MPFILRGVIYDQHGWAMTPTYTRNRHKKSYRYYVSQKALKEGYDSTDLRTIPAEEIETVIVGHIRQFFTAPEIVHRTHLRAQQQEPNVSADEVREKLGRFHEIWDQLFPIEQNRIVKLLVQRIQVSTQGIDITYQPNGFMELYAQIPRQRLAM
jgi:site-specific DNA recombinase